MSQSSLEVVFNITVELIRGAVAAKVDSMSHISLSITVRFQREADSAALELVVLDNGEGIKLGSLGLPLQTRGAELRHAFRTYRVQSLVILSAASNETTQAVFCFDHALGDVVMIQQQAFAERASSHGTRVQLSLPLLSEPEMSLLIGKLEEYFERFSTQSQSHVASLKLMADQGVMGGAVGQLTKEFTTIGAGNPDNHDTYGIDLGVRLEEMYDVLDGENQILTASSSNSTESLRISLALFVSKGEPPIVQPNDATAKSLEGESEAFVAGETGAPLSFGLELWRFLNGLPLEETTNDETCTTIMNSVRGLDWKKFGLKLCVGQGCLYLQHRVPQRSFSATKFARGVPTKLLIMVEINSCTVPLVEGRGIQQRISSLLTEFQRLPDSLGKFFMKKRQQQAVGVRTENVPRLALSLVKSVNLLPPEIKEAALELLGGEQAGRANAIATLEKKILETIDKKAQEEDQEGDDGEGDEDNEMVVSNGPELEDEDGDEGEEEEDDSIFEIARLREHLSQN